MGRIYQRYLKRYSLVRTFVIWTWTTFLPIGLLIYGRFKFLQYKSLPLKKLSEYLPHRRVVFPRQLVQTPLPDVFSKKKNVLNSQTEFEFPEVYITTINNCIVTGASNFLDVDEGIICHDLFRCSHDYTSEELHGRFIINSRKSLITKTSKIKVENEIQDGAVFTDAVSGNYAHFLTEVLPRIFIFSKEYPNTKITLIIDCNLNPNLMEALEMVVGENVDLIGLEMGEILLVKSLQVVSACGYVPFERRPHTNHFSDHSHGIFSPSALLGMRDLIKSKVATLSFNTEANVTHKKIWIKRNSTYRNVSNADEIQSALITQGFMVIEPEKLSLAEQVTIFSNADVIVGATGAAFANLIFCKPETKIIILISELKDTSYGYWQNMACTVDNRVTYVLGVTQNSRDNIHADFSVDLNDLMASIK